MARAIKSNVVRDRSNSYLTSKSKPDVTVRPKGTGASMTPRQRATSISDRGSPAKNRAAMQRKVAKLGGPSKVVSNKLMKKGH